MSLRPWQFRLDHIIENVENVMSFTAGLHFDAFKEDRKTIYAVLTAFSIIGEAARAIPKDIRELHPEVPWNMMIRMRNVLIHEYHRVNLQIVWETIHQDLPTLLMQVQNLRGR